MDGLSLTATYEIDDSFDSEKFIKMRAKIMHSNINPNQSNFDNDVINKAKMSIYNTPVLANVIWDDEDIPDFGAHDMHIEIDRIDGSKNRMIYDEQPIGVVPESCNYKLENIDGISYVFADVYMFKNYINYAKDIIERDGEIKLSMEIYVDKYQYDNKTNITNIIEYRYKGITFLGRKYQTGMKNAKAKIHSSKEEKTQAFIELVDELKFAISQHQQSTPKGVDINKNDENHLFKNKENGGNDLDKIKELLDIHSLTYELLDFQIDGLSFEEFEIKLNDFLKKQPKKNTNNQKFSLNIMEKINEINTILSTEKYEHEYWGVTPRYYLVDIQDNEVICYDVKNNFNLYGIAVIEDGDALSLDFANCKRKKTKYEDFVDGGEAGSIEVFIKDVVDRITSKYEQDKDLLNIEFEQYKQNHSVSNVDFEKLKTIEMEMLSEKHKLNIDAVLSEFSDLKDNKDFIALKDTALSFEDIEELKEKCYAIRGKSATVKFSKAPTENIKIQINEPKSKPDAPYGGLIERYNS